MDALLNSCQRPFCSPCIVLDAVFSRAAVGIVMMPLRMLQTASKMVHVGLRTSPSRVLAAMRLVLRASDGRAMSIFWLQRPCLQILQAQCR